LRGRAFAFNQVVQFCAVPFVALVSWQLVPLQPLGLDGWRWVALIGAAGALFVWVIRRSVPESPRWLIAHGKLEEADRVVTAMETRVQAELKVPLPEPVSVPHEDAKATFADILRAPYLRRTLMLSVAHFFQTIGYYGFASWVPTLMIAAGFTTTSSLRYSFLIALASPLSPFLAFRTADRVERKWQIVLGAISVAVTGLLFAQQKDPVWLIVCGVLLTCANNWMAFGFHAYQSEVFPTRVRARAVGFVYSWSRVSAIFSGFMIAFVLRDFGTTGVFTFIAVSMLAVVISIGIFGPRTRGLALEEISH
jgi:MFS transporter, putative metabolite:H+ symporter